MLDVEAGATSGIPTSDVRSMAELGELLRRLRRRQARRSRERELSYREIAARTGWSTAIVGGYLSGTAMPPTDRFDELVRLLGAEPSELGALATARDRVADRRRATRPTAVRSGPDGPPAPRQLPARTGRFTGRAAELAEMDTLLGAADGTGPLTLALVGPPGAGKTALAVQWAHRAARSYPDGQLYLDLCGFRPSGAPIPVETALRLLLEALGVRPDAVPTRVDAQSALYRSLLADSRTLVVLDNAWDAEQVQPLLPGGSGCAAVVTSRSRLTALVAGAGALPICVDRLTGADAERLLAARVGAARARAEPQALARLVAGCDRWPLALALVGARAATNPEFALADLAADLDPPTGLDVFDVTGSYIDLRSVFSWSYQRLDVSTARVFRLLGLVDGPELGTQAVSRLAGLGPEETRRRLADLVDAHLVVAPSKGCYTMHDLIRLYACELADALDRPDERSRAIERLLGGRGGRMSPGSAVEVSELS